MDYSILIPVFNYDIRELIGQLLNQMRKLSLNGELLILDDASTDSTIKKVNEQLKKHPEIIYLSERNNIGRAKARNKLILESNSDKLIFIDADVLIKNEDYLQNYVRLFSKYQVVVGGHRYQEERPEYQYRLNWRYANKREVLSATVKNRNPYDRFISMNFYADKRAISSISFPNFLDGWGHEDTYFGFLLKKQGFSINHIENPVLHLGLHENKAYIKRQEMAIDQALKIRAFDADFDYQLVRIANNIKSLHPLLHSIAPISLSYIRRMVLMTNSPMILNIYKLIFYIQRIKEEN